MWLSQVHVVRVEFIRSFHYKICALVFVFKSILVFLWCIADWLPFCMFQCAKQVRQVRNVWVWAQQCCEIYFKFVKRDYHLNPIIYRPEGSRLRGFLVDQLYYWGFLILDALKFFALFHKFEVAILTRKSLLAWVSMNFFSVTRRLFT